MIQKRQPRQGRVDFNGREDSIGRDGRDGRVGRDRNYGNYGGSRREYGESMTRGRNKSASGRRQRRRGICFHGMDCQWGMDCKFSHTQEEMDQFEREGRRKVQQRRRCRYGVNCRDAKRGHCNFDHPEEELVIIKKKAMKKGRQDWKRGSRNDYKNDYKYDQRGKPKSQYQKQNQKRRNKREQEHQEQRAEEEKEDLFQTPKTHS